MNDMTAAEGGLFAGPNVVSRIAEDGTIYLSSGYTLPVASGRVTDWLVDGADAHPDRVFLAEHMGDGWRSVTYAQALARAETLGAWLLEQTKGDDPRWAGAQVLLRRWRQLAARSGAGGDAKKAAR